MFVGMYVCIGPKGLTLSSSMLLGDLLHSVLEPEVCELEEDPANSLFHYSFHYLGKVQIQRVFQEFFHCRKRRTKSSNELTTYTLPGCLCRVSTFSGTHSSNSLFLPLLLITLNSCFDMEKISYGKQLKKIF